MEDRRGLEMTGCGGFAHPKSPTVVGHLGDDRKPSPQGLHRIPSANGKLRTCWRLQVVASICSWSASWSLHSSIR